MRAVCFLFESARRALRGRRGRGLVVVAGPCCWASPAAAQQPAPPEADSSAPPCASKPATRPAPRPRCACRWPSRLPTRPGRAATPGRRWP
ncbi:MAG: hypothetical protein WKG07_03585 [Hymenobacter sp.]